MLLAGSVKKLFAEVLWVQFETPSYPPQFQVYLVAIAISIIAVFAMSWHPMRTALATSPMLFFRQPEVSRVKLLDWLVQAIPLVLVVLGLMYWILGNLEWIQWLVIGFAVAAVVLSGISLLLFALLRKGTSSWGGMLRVLGSDIMHHRLNNSMLTAVLALATAPIILVLSLQGNMLSQWSEVEADRPNFFVFNLGPGEAREMQATLQASGAEPGNIREQGQVNFVDVLRNGKSIKELDKPLNPRNRIGRSISISSFHQLPANSRIVAGEIWHLPLPDLIGQQSTLMQASLDDEFAEENGVEIGDELVLSAGGVESRVQVTSFRAVDWLAMQPGFWVVVSPDVLENYPTTAIFSFKAESAWKSNLPAVAREYATASILNLDDVLLELERLFAKMQSLLWVISLATLVATLVVLFQIGVYSNSRKNLRSGLLRVLGSRRLSVFFMLLGESVIVGMIGGGIGGFAADIQQFGIASTFLQESVSLQPMTWLYGALLGGLMMAIATAYASIRATTVPPMQVLKSDQ